jgi:hypothetical protein
MPHLLRLLTFLLLFLLLAETGCKKGEVKSPEDPDLVGPAERRVLADVNIPKIRFTDITAKAGITFAHLNGAFGKKLLPETMGAGCAFFDFDKDGKQDLLLINSCHWPGYEDKKNPAPTMELYRNKGNGKFQNVTKGSGLDVTFYGMGVTIGDYDNDGWPDVFITGVGGNRLFHNEPGDQGARKFVDVTKQSGDLAQNGAWPPGVRSDFLSSEAILSFPSSAAFLDYDNDGLLDLFVCNYVEWSPQADWSQKFTLLGGDRAYGPPRAFKGTNCGLYRNLGGGRFADVTVKAGIPVSSNLGEPAGKSLGVVVADVDEDGWPDIVVANDTVRNFFFHNRGDGSFEEKGGVTGIAYAEGTARGAMGIDWGEYRAGRFALVIGNFANEPNTLLRLDNKRPLLFSDVALVEGLAGPSRIVLKFGLFFFDFDLDGLLDLLTCNGHLEPKIHLVQASQSYQQPAQLFWNTGGRRTFEVVRPEHSGPDLFKALVGRGCAYADIDGNGTLDVVLTENGGPARLLKNEGGTGNHWLRLDLEGDGKKTNRSAIGARVTLTADGKTQKREVTSARGYLSQSEFTLTFGLGKATKVDRVEIRWPGPHGQTQVFADLAVDRLYRLTQGGKIE